MRLRLALARYEVRFLLVVVYWTVFWGLGMFAWNNTRGTNTVDTIFVALASGVGFAFLTVGRTEARRQKLVDAVTGLTPIDRSQAIAAVTHGVVPADDKVRSAAIRLGETFLGDKSADERKRQQRRNAAVLAGILIVGVVAIGFFTPGSYAFLYFAALAVLSAATTYVDVLNTRQLQRNVGLLSWNSASRESFGELP